MQLNYHDVVVQATDQYTGTLSYNQTFNGSRSLSIATAITSALARTIGTAFAIGGIAQRQDLLSFKADPITDQDDIYDLYRSFAKDPRNLLTVSNSAPPKEVVHQQLIRKCDGCYYYIPCYASKEFMDLVLATTFQRGFNSARYAFPVTVKGTVDISREMPPDQGMVHVMVFFDAKVPNGDGILIFRHPQSGNKARLRVETVLDDPTTPGKIWNGNGEEIDHLRAKWYPAKEGFGPADLRYAKGQVLSLEHPAPFTNIDTVAKKANNNLESIRANTSIVTLKTPFSQ
jgi:hypothetical protein